MQIVTADWETYYDKYYSLTKLTTEEYIRDDRFEAIMLGLRWPDGTKEIITGTPPEIEYRLQAVDWSKYAILCHNTLFDAAIFAWRFKVKPAAWLDTLSMARAMFGVKGNSLAVLAKRYNLEDKGTEVMNAMGKRLADFTQPEFDAYAKYCLHDVELCFQLFELMSLGWYDLESFDKRDPYPIKELELIDKLIRMYTEPRLVLNKEKLETHLAEVKKAKEELLAKCTADKDTLMSGHKFANLLVSMGVTPPVKLSPTTGKTVWAFAKTDPGMKALLEHEDDRVQALVAARMGVKSTLEETRTERFIAMAERNPKMPIPLRYSAARTHRLGGMDNINMQNLPSRGPQAGKLKRCIEAPPGYVLIDSDSSNIEARMLAWLAGQDDLVEDFRNGVDTYCKIASKIFGREITKTDKKERFVGKTVVLGCFGPDTQVLTDSGWKPIVGVQLSDRLWDGEEWVTHSGLLNQGYRWTETPTDLMLHATEDHEILTEHGWRAWSEVHSNPSLLKSALDKARLPLSIGSKLDQGGTPKYGATAVGKVCLTAAISSIKTLGCVVTALGSSLLKPASGTGGMQILSPMTPTENGYLTVSRHVSTGVRYRPASSTATTGVGAYESMRVGGKTVEPFLGTLLRLKAGTSQNWSWIGSITKKGTSQKICGLFLEFKTYAIGALLATFNKKSSVLKQRTLTYDIALSGPRNRFTVMTARGPLVVHNCGYQTGATKLQVTLKASEFALDLPLSECENIIDTYRASVPRIKSLWYQGDACIETMYRDKTQWFGREGVAFIEGRHGVKLPSGLYISYPQLHRGHNKKGQESWQYKDEKGLTDLYGGKFTENVVQALARIVVMYQLLKISKKLRVVLTVHDSVVVLAREDEAVQAQAFVEECMRWVPKWAEGCPINCESEIGRVYGH